MRALLLALCCFFSATSRSAQAAPPEAEPAAGARRLDGLAAVVGATAPGPGSILILRSSVALRARLALLAGGSLELALGELPSGVLVASLSELLGEALIATEARRLNLARPGAVARARERQRILEAAGPRAEELLQALGVGEPELAAWAERRAVVSGFLAANLEGTLDVSPLELERLFRSESHPYRDEPFDAASARFAAWLARQRTEEAVRRWVDTLTQRIPHRILAVYPSSDSPAR